MANFLDEYSEYAKQDTDDFIKMSKNELKRWIEDYEEGKLSKSELGFLIQGKMDLFELNALKNAGLSQMQLDRFKDALMYAMFGSLSTIYFIDPDEPWPRS